jgi:hypothetical protein
MKTKPVYTTFGVSGAGGSGWLLWQSHRSKRAHAFGLTGGPAKRDYMVVISGERIAAMGAVAKLRPPKGAQVVRDQLPSRDRQGAVSPKRLSTPLRGAAPRQFML